jgi:ribosomal protein L6P/L9E
MTDTTTHHINESADKITLKTKLKRGTGTRDEDKYDLKVKGNDAEDVAETMATLQAAMQDHGLVGTTRAMQPGDGDE